MKPTCLSPFCFGLLCLLFLLFSQAVVAKISTKFYSCSWQELQKIALYQDKPIFVEIFANDSDSSKDLADLFNDAEVSDFYNTNFINYRVDFNTELGAEFRRQYHVSSVPEVLFFDTDGTVMYRKTGNRSKNDVLILAETAVRRYLLTIDVMQYYYNDGYRAPAFLHDYAYELQKNKLSNVRIVNDYIQQKRLNKHITKLEDLQFLYDFAGNPYTDALRIICKHIELFYKEYSAEVIDRKIENIVIGNTSQAANTHDEKLYLRTRKIIQKSKLDYAPDLLLRIDAAYFNTSAEN